MRVNELPIDYVCASFQGSVDREWLIIRRATPASSTRDGLATGVHKIYCSLCCCAAGLHGVLTSPCCSSVGSTDGHLSVELRAEDHQELPIAAENKTVSWYEPFMAVQRTITLHSFAVLICVIGTVLWAFMLEAPGPPCS